MKTTHSEWSTLVTFLWKYLWAAWAYCMTAVPIWHLLPDALFLMALLIKVCPEDLKISLVLSVSQSLLGKMWKKRKCTSFSLFSIIFIIRPKQKVKESPLYAVHHFPKENSAKETRKWWAQQEVLLIHCPFDSSSWRTCSLSVDHFGLLWVPHSLVYCIPWFPGLYNCVYSMVVARNALSPNWNLVFI